MIYLYNFCMASIARVFAQNVAYYRKKLGLSQYDLSQKSGISRTMISHYEREGMLPPPDRLEALADALNVPVYKLFKEHEKERKAEADLSDLDPRSVKKLKDILSLSPGDRNNLYRILNTMLRKNLLEKQRKAK